MPLNMALKVAITMSRKKQKQIAKRMRMSESVFSRKVHGDLSWGDGERERVAQILGLPAPELFPELQSDRCAS